MAVVPTRVLIINKQVKFAIRLKQSLELYGGFVVSPFTAADTAIEHVKHSPHDVALVDFTLPGTTGPELVRRIRQYRPDIAIIASPDTPDVALAVRQLNLHGIINVPITMRQLVPIIHRAVSQANDALPDTTEAPAAQPDTETLLVQPPPLEEAIRSRLHPSQAEPSPSADSAAPEESKAFSSLESVLFKVGGLDVPVGTETLDVDMQSAEYTPEQDSQNIEVVLKGSVNRLINKLEQDDAASSPTISGEGDGENASEERATEVFKQLAAEEPPMPAVEESGTIRELRSNLEAANLQAVAELMSSAESQADDDMDDGDDDEKGSTARLILENALDETSPLDLSISQLMRSIEKDFPEDSRGIKPLPSWLKDLERYVKEPDFLGDTGALEVSQPPKPTSTLQPTIDSANQETELLPREATHTDSPEPQPTDQDDVAQSFDFSWLDRLSQPLEGQLEGEETAEEVNTDNIPELADLTSDIKPLPAPPPGLPGAVEEDYGGETPIFPIEADETETEPELDAEVAPDLPAQADVAAGVDAPTTELPLAPYAFDAASTRTPLPQPTSVDGQLTFGADNADPEIAQLAVSLTQASLDLTAEATLLAYQGEVVAYAGNLPVEDIEDVRTIITDDWNTNPDEVRIRFITLPASGDDYMLYSCRTEADYTLSMIFAGNMPLRVIRKQSTRLLEALKNIPEEAADATTEDTLLEDLRRLEAEAEQEEAEAVQSTQQVRALQVELEDEPITATAEAGTQPPTTEQQEASPEREQALETPRARHPYTYLWVIRDEDNPLNVDAAEAIVGQLDAQLTERGWNVKKLEVYEDYVYLLADVPGTDLANKIMPELKVLSAQIAQAVDPAFDPATLWADSYFVLSPGRELDEEEIQNFINFSRM